MSGRPPGGILDHALFDVLSDIAPSTARFHPAEVEQILQCVEEGVYCAVLGPRLCGKTELLLYIEQILIERLGWVCVYIDLAEMRSSSLQDFFAELIRLVLRRFGELTGVWIESPAESEASSAVFRAFLLDSAQTLGQDLILIIEHLEAALASFRDVAMGLQRD